jgi:hypothetical protein
MTCSNYYKHIYKRLLEAIALYAWKVTSEKAVRGGPNNFSKPGNEYQQKFYYTTMHH